MALGFNLSALNTGINGAAIGAGTQVQPTPTPSPMTNYDGSPIPAQDMTTPPFDTTGKVWHTTGGVMGGYWEDPNNPRGPLAQYAGQAGPAPIDPSRYDPTKSYADYARDYWAPDRQAVLQGHPDYWANQQKLQRSGGMPNQNPNAAFNRGGTFNTLTDWIRSNMSPAYQQSLGSFGGLR